MKKVLSILMVVMALANALWFAVGTASAASLSVVIYLPGVPAEQLKGASIFVGSEYHAVSCVLKDAETGKVVCKVSEKFASEGGVLYVAGLSFFVNLPSHGNNGNQNEATEPLSCEAPEVLGAMVKFVYSNGVNPPVQWFVAGATLEEVEQNAQNYIGMKFSSFEVLGDLYCSGPT